MGCGSWTSSSFKDYAMKCSYSVSAATGEITDDCSVQDLYKQKTLDAGLSNHFSQYDDSSQQKAKPILFRRIFYRILPDYEKF